VGKPDDDHARTFANRFDARALGRDHWPALGRLHGLSALEAVVKYLETMHYPRKAPGSAGASWKLTSQ
jgi:hypothetical protein